MAVTIRDVANLAGVSTATVSLVLNGRSDARISDATRQRVRRAAAELDFQPNLMARWLITGKTQVIGLIVDDVENLLMARTIRGVEQAAREHRHHLIVCEASTQEAEADTIRWIKSRGVDGFILASGVTRNTAFTESLDQQGVPIVLVNQEGAADTISLLPDDREAGRLAANLFLDAGYRKLAYLGTEPARASQDRLAGYCEAAAERGAEVSAFLDPAPLYRRSMSRSAERLVLSAFESGCDAALCYNDYAAFGAIQGLRLIGRSVPDDMAVIGVDDSPLAAITQPAISSFDLNMGEIGVRAAMALIEGNTPKGCIRIAPRFIARQSSGRVVDPEPVCPWSQVMAREPLNVITPPGETPGTD